MEGEGGAGVAGGVGCGVGFTTTTRGKRLDEEIEFDPDGGVDGTCGGCECGYGGVCGWGCESSTPGRGDTTTQAVAADVDWGCGDTEDASQDGLEWKVGPPSLLSGSMSTMMRPTQELDLERTLDGR